MQSPHWHAAAHDIDVKLTVGSRDQRVELDVCIDFGNA